jgi:hypothetical protein
MKMKTLLIGIALLAVVFVACGGPRYGEPPHSSWKEREEYCFFFQVDPKGGNNNNVGWSDTRPIVTETAAGRTLTAVNARVNLYNEYTHLHGDANDDWFRPDVLWATSVNGVVNVDRRCRNEL